MNPKQREILVGLQRQAYSLDYFSGQLTRNLELLASTFEVDCNKDFSEADINVLLSLNLQLSNLEEFIYQQSVKACHELNLRVLDPADPVYDFEADVHLDFIVRSTDPTFDPDDDNILTSREYSIKRLDRESGIADIACYKEPCKRFPGLLNEVRHSFLFHDLSHSYNLDQQALSLVECLKIGKVWINFKFTVQTALDVDGGNWGKP